MSAAQIGYRVRSRRHQLGLSQREVSAPGVSPQYLSRIEQGARARDCVPDSGKGILAPCQSPAIHPGEIAPHPIPVNVNGRRRITTSSSLGYSKKLGLISNASCVDIASGQSAKSLRSRCCTNPSVLRFRFIQQCPSPASIALTSSSSTHPWLASSLLGKIRADRLGHSSRRGQRTLRRRQDHESRPQVSPSAPHRSKAARVGGFCHDA